MSRKKQKALVVARLALLGRGSSPCSVPASFRLHTPGPSRPIGHRGPQGEVLGWGSQEPSSPTRPLIPWRGLAEMSRRRRWLELKGSHTWWVDVGRGGQLRGCKAQG